MYTDKQAAKMDRLERRLRKIGYRLYGINDGFGQVGIFTSSYEQIPDSHYWLADFVEGRLTGQHIVKALLTGATPHEVAAAAAAKKERRNPKVVRLPGGECAGMNAESEEEEGTEALVLSEHWEDLNAAAIEAARALAEISLKYHWTAFELSVLGCEEYPYVPIGVPRRADPPTVRVRAYSGGFEDCTIPEWSEIRAEIERAQTKKGTTNE